MNEALLKQFDEQMLNLYYVLGNQTRYWAKRYKQKVVKDGGLKAAKLWLRPQVKHISGLERLANLNRLDLSFETLVLKEPWSQFFTANELQVARGRLNVMAGGILPEEVDNTLTEGAKYQLFVNKYERNAEARRLCLQHYGTDCSVCKVNLSKVYGPVADSFIHVHHLRSLSTIGHQYKIDPIKDLRPVCPNCHAIIHLSGQTRSIEEVQAMLNQ